MPRNARCVVAGLPYHVTQRGTKRQRVFYSPTDYKIYLSLVQEQLGDAECRVLAYGLMTDPVHLVVVAERADSLAVLFRRVHGRYSQYLNTRRNRTGHLWQQRDFSCPLPESHHWVAWRGGEQNPCRAFMVHKPEEYRWSSAAAHLAGKDTSGLLEMEFWSKAGEEETWREMHTAPERADQLLLLRGAPIRADPTAMKIS